MADSRSNEAQEPSGSDLDAFAPPSGNRAATGARAADSPHAAGAGWHPSAGATDFLGLEQDVRAEPGASGPTESWLFDIEQAERESASTTAPAAEHAADADDGEADADAETAGSEGEPESETGAPAKRGSRRVLVAAALAVVAIGSWYAWDRYGATSGLAPEVATLPTKPPTPRPTPSEAVKPPTPTTAPVTTPTNVEVAVAPEPTPVVATPEVAVAETTPVEIAPSETPPTPAPEQPAVAAEPSLQRSPDAELRTPVLPTGAPGPGGGRHATDLDWAGMWLEPTIPTDAIHGATRLRTLNVGLVRAELQHGEYVEGNLYAVGESRIWLDLKLGRMSFGIGDVRELVQVVGSQGQPLALGAKTLENRPRVEVRLPGGSLVGRVVGRENGRVTFVTEDGMRLRVDAEDVRPAPNGRTRLIGPVASQRP